MYLLFKSYWIKFAFFKKLNANLLITYIYIFLSYCFMFFLNEALWLLYKYFGDDCVWLKWTLLKLTYLYFLIQFLLPFYHNRNYNHPHFVDEHTRVQMTLEYLQDRTACRYRSEVPKSGLLTSMQNYCMKRAT